MCPRDDNVTDGGPSCTNANDGLDVEEGARETGSRSSSVAGSSDYDATYSSYLVTPLRLLLTKASACVKRSTLVDNLEHAQCQHSYTMFPQENGMYHCSQYSKRLTIMVGLCRLFLLRSRLGNFGAMHRQAVNMKHPHVTNLKARYIVFQLR